MKSLGGSRRPELIGNLALLIFVLLLCLAGAEIALRLAGLQIPAANPDLYVFDDTLGWIGRPNLGGKPSPSRPGAFAEMNRWGFRDDQPASWEAASKRRRVMLLGDSYAMGYEIPKAMRVSELLEKADTLLLVYNFGILAYSSDQELLVLKKYGPEIRPEIILVFFCVNDIYYNEQDESRHPKPLFQRQADGTLRLVNVPLRPPDWLDRSAGWLTTHLALGKITSQAVARLTMALRPVSRRTQSERWFVGRAGGREEQLLNASTEQASNLTYSILRDIRNVSARLGAELYVFMCPSSARWTETRDDSPEGIKLAQSWWQNLNVPVVDLFPVLRKDWLDNKEDLYIYDKMHWNERANRLIADSVMKTIQTRFSASPDTSN